jgi:SPP1 family predicted phage head-tail adaptor
VRMLDEIVLRAKTTTQGANGYPVEEVSQRAVFADVLGVTRAEHYAAQGAGTRADVVFVVATDEYNGETEVKYGGKVYDVTRTHERMEARTNTRSYRADPTRMELICVRR